MTQYQDELEQLRFTAAEQEALRRGLLEKREEKRRAVSPRYRDLVAAVAAVSLLIGAAGATSLAGLSPQFRELFGIDSARQEEQLGALALEQVFEDKNGTGASITVKEMVADQERLYLRMEFAAPAGTVVPVPDQVEEGKKRCWFNGDTGYACSFYADEGCTVLANPPFGWSYGVEYLADNDPADNRVELLFTLSTERGFSDRAAYCVIQGISELSMQVGGQDVTVAEGLDIDMVIPFQSATEYYAFQGRSFVKLGGTTLAVVENLTVSPISITMDLIIPGKQGHTVYAATGEEERWPVYVLLSDGTRVQAAFPEGAWREMTCFLDEDGEPFFRADHMYLELEQVIDVAEIVDIVFVGDNDGTSTPGKVVCFQFTPGTFWNDTYWNQVNRTWNTGGTTEEEPESSGQAG